MANLDREHKRFIVQELARFKTPSEVVESVKENLGIEISRQQVWHYNPRNPDVAEEWRELHKETREQFIKDTASIGISHKNFRIGQLEEMFHKLKKAGNYTAAREMLEQAAKEEGGVFTNKRELSGPQGGAIPLDVMGAIEKVYGTPNNPTQPSEPTGTESSASDTGVG